MPLSFPNYNDLLLHLKSHTPSHSSLYMREGGVHGGVLVGCLVLGTVDLLWEGGRGVPGVENP